MKKNIEIGHTSYARTSVAKARSFSRLSRLLLASTCLSCLPIVLAQDVFTNGLVAHYPFNATATDITGNGNDGTVNGATLATDRFGNLNSAYAFSGAYISIPYSDGFNISPNGQFTISVWARPAISTTINSYAMFVKGNWDYGLYYAGTNSQFGVGDGAAAYCMGRTVVVPGTWYHVVGTYSNGNWALYVNGSLETAVYDPRLITQSAGYEAIGRKGTASQDYFPGDIDDVRFYNRALASSEIGQLYAYESSQDPLASGLVAYYPFNGTAADASGNGNDGTIQGATPTTDRFGNANSAYAFNISYISIPYAKGFDIPPNGAFTISAWAQPAITTTMNSYALFVKGNFDWDYGLYYAGTNSQFGVGDGAAGYCMGRTVVVPGTWYHVVGTYSNANWAIYVNGSLERAVYDPRFITQSANGAAIGCKGTALQDWFPGAIDDVRFYNRALSSSDAARLYAFESHHAYITVAKAVRLDYQYLLVGTNYQLQVSYDLKSWASLGLPFTATSTTSSQYVDATNASAFYRLVAP